jgi:hypothetical protein
VLGASRRDKIRSEDVRKQLNTEQMVEEIQEYQKKWHNDVERMPSEHILWQTYSYHPTGRWGTGHPRRRWRDNSFSLGTSQQTQSLNGKKKKTILQIQKDAKT